MRTEQSVGDVRIYFCLYLLKMFCVLWVYEYGIWYEHTRMSYCIIHYIMHCIRCILVYIVYFRGYRGIIGITVYFSNFIQYLVSVSVCIYFICHRWPLWRSLQDPYPSIEKAWCFRFFCLFVELYVRQLAIVTKKALWKMNQLNYLPHCFQT